MYDFLYNQTKEQNYKEFYLIYTANINLPISVEEKNLLDSLIKKDKIAFDNLK